MPPRSARRSGIQGALPYRVGGRAQKAFAVACRAQATKLAGGAKASCALQARAICRYCATLSHRFKRRLAVAEGWRADCWLFLARQRASRGAEASGRGPPVAELLCFASGSKRSAQKEQLAVVQGAGCRACKLRRSFGRPAWRHALLLQGSGARLPGFQISPLRNIAFFPERKAKGCYKGKGIVKRVTKAVTIARYYSIWLMS